MKDDDHSPRGSGKPVSLLTLALRQQEEAPPRTRRARSNAFHNEADHQRQTGLDIHQLRREWAQEAISQKGAQTQVYLHALTRKGEAEVRQKGLLTKNQRGVKFTPDYESTNNSTDVFVGGPNVMRQHFGAGIESRSRYVHVIGDPAHFVPDSDYNKTLKGNNDSVSYVGGIPPLRDARAGDTGPKSFMEPMSPNTKAGASRYMAGVEGFGNEAEAEIKRKFKARFDDK
ncbi:hypothetical protein [Paraburkholderia humisilvae]|uniref:Uncharacterized protein n=1 Tax=Paraburkholderia humisilvae TaxID=627669 RepID=A0A6J5EYU0_9BURK|nr:hypothetical protein [Paraburkholderia humisilvae]CAB3770175.1 hypothetical protein LMG29542_06288 [Paraburkholderia humisilvae]